MSLTAVVLALLLFGAHAHPGPALVSSQKPRSDVAAHAAPHLATAHTTTPLVIAPAAPPLRAAHTSTPLVIAPAAVPVAAPHARWLWPTGGAQVVLRGYSAPATRYAAGHRGIDVATNGEIRAPADGVVHFAGMVVDRPVVSVMHANGYLSSFEPVVTSLRKGESVIRGQLIGEVRSSYAGSETPPPARADEVPPGHCAEPCLHFGVRLHGEYVSPLVLLGGIPRSVLLPTRRTPG